MSRKDDDLLAWEQWHRTRSTKDLDTLLKRMEGVIQKEVNRWQGVLARPVLEAEASRLAVQAFENYNPSMGAALTTHLTNWLKKLSRIVYTNQNLARIPEHQTPKIKAYDRSIMELEDTYGRPPTTLEVADHLGWSEAAVSSLRKVRRAEHIESREIAPIFGRDSTDGLVDLVYYDLTPQQKLIFEYTTGYGNSPVLSNPEITKKLNITQGQLSYEKRKIIDKINTVKGK